jgi:hypothetical protein
MKKIISTAVAFAVLGGSNAIAAVSDAEFEELKKQFAAMSQRLNTLEEENRALKGLGVATVVPVEDLAATNEQVAVLKEQNTATSWAENIKWTGDFRFRYETIDEEGRDDRRRNRIRARPAMMVKLPYDVEIGAGLATGGDDPVSTNQTLGGGGSTKDIRLDLAYFKWAPNEFFLQGGKYKNPWKKVQKSQLIYDNDLRPEGFALGWESQNIYAVFNHSWIDSDSREDGFGDDDDFSWGLQVGGKFGPFVGSIGYSELPTAGRAAIFDDDFFGNSSVDGPLTERYRFDYEVFALAGGLEFEVGLPLAFYAEIAQNQDADDLDTAWQVGAKLGKAKARGDWQLQYEYREVEADSVLGLWTDSDFGGGGTDVKGHRLSGKYAINKQWSLAVTYFNNKRGVDLGDNVDYERIMLDTAFKY